MSSDLKDYNIHTSDAMKDNFRKQIQEKYVTALVTQLTSRLPDVVELEAFSILDPSKLPQESAEGYTTKLMIIRIFFALGMVLEIKQTSPQRNYVQNG